MQIEISEAGYLASESQRPKRSEKAKQKCKSLASFRVETSKKVTSWSKQILSSESKTSKKKLKQILASSNKNELVSMSVACGTFHCGNGISGKRLGRDAAIAQWIRLCLSSCHSGFESQAHHHLYLHCEKNQNKQKQAVFGPFWKNLGSAIIYLLSLGEIIPVSSFPETFSRTLHASFAKSRSRTSVGPTAMIAKASLSSLMGAQPTWNIFDDFKSGKRLISTLFLAFHLKF